MGRWESSRGAKAAGFALIGLTVGCCGVTVAGWLLAGLRLLPPS